ncbi:MAG: stage II sporulation protein E [Bacillota bacterium]|nr:stage II sporulation protein E [Bacillota bacterium]
MLDQPPIAVYRRLPPYTTAVGAREEREQAKKALWQKIVLIWGALVSPVHLPLNFFSFLLGRGSLFGSLHPFLPAVVAASLSLGLPRSAALSLAAFLGLLSGSGWRASLPALGALLLFLLLRGWAARRDRRPLWLQAPVLVSLAVAAAGSFSTALRGAWSGGEGIFILLEAVVAGALTALLSHLFTLRRDLLLRRGLSRPEAGAILLVLGVAVQGLAGWELFSYPLSDLAVRWLTVCAAWIAGSGAGAAAGVVLGSTSALLSGTSFYSLPVYGFLGVLSGLFNDRGRPGVLGGVALAVALLAYQSADLPQLLHLLKGAALLSLLILATPSWRVKELARLVPGTAERQAQERVQQKRLQERVASRLHDFSRIFEELAGSFGQVSAAVFPERPNASVLLNAIIERACGPCERAKSCWEGSFYSTYRDLLDLLTLAEVGGGASLLDVPPRLRLRCSSPHKVVTATNYLLDVYRINNAWERRLAESREIVSGQLRGVAQMMKELASRAQVELRFRYDLEGRLAMALAAEKIPVEHIAIAERGESRLVVEVLRSRCAEKHDCTTRLGAVLSRVLGRPYSLHSHRCGWSSATGGCTFVFWPSREYEIVTRVASLAGSKGGVCGDNHALIELSEGRVAILLSDGMGTGSRAAWESSTTVSVLKRLLQAGFDCEFAVKTVNSILLLRSPEESFATVDLLVLNLYSGEAEFVKVGAVATYIKRGRQIMTIDCRSLPIGILTSIEAEVTRRLLRPGDLVVMVTDGVLESGLQQHHEGDWVVGALERLETDDPQVVALELLEQAKARVAGNARDDMTVVVTRLDKGKHG